MREKNYLSKFYWKTKQRRGAKKAVVALSRKILVIVYNLLKHGYVYDEKKYEITRIKQEFLRIKKITAEANKLGYDLIPQKKCVDAL